MKVYLQKGQGMSASLKIDPFTGKIEKEPDCMPDAIRGWMLTIDGEGNETIIVQGTTEEMETLLSLMVQAFEVLKEVKEDRRWSPRHSANRSSTSPTP